MLNPLAVKKTIGMYRMRGSSPPLLCDPGSGGWGPVGQTTKQCEEKQIIMTQDTTLYDPFVHTIGEAGLTTTAVGGCCQHFFRSLGGLANIYENWFLTVF